MLSLLEWATRPGADDDAWSRWDTLHATSPLPTADGSFRHAADRWGYRRSASWHIGDLDPLSLAASLADRGLTYRNGLGWLVDGDRVTTDTAGRLVAEVLIETAAALPGPPFSREWAARSGLPDDVEKIDRAATWRRALEDTARDLRNSSGARRAALGLVMPHLDRTAEPADDADPSAASAWLARLDDTPSVRRADLGRDYASAGYPGALTLRALYALASERWADPVHVRGYPTFHPLRSR